MLLVGLIAIWCAALVEVVAGNHLWGGDFTAFYTGFTVAAEQPKGSLYDPQVQQEVQKRILRESALAAGEKSPRAFKDDWLPYPYPPHLALTGAWISAVPLDAALLGWLGVQLVLLVVMVVLLWRMTAGWRRHERLFAVTAVLASHALLKDLQQGQPTLLLFVLLLVVYRAMCADRQARCALAWLGLTIKPQIALMPGAVLVGGHRLRTLAVMVAVGGAWVLITGLWLGFEVWPGFFRMIHDLANFDDRLAIFPDTMANLRGLLAVLAGGASLSTLNWIAGSALLAAVLGALVFWWRHPAPEPEVRDLAFGLTIGLGIYLSLHLNEHDILHMALPALLLYDRLRTGRPRAAMGLSIWVVALNLALVADVFQPSSWGLPRLPGLLLMGLCAWMAVELVRALRRAPARAPDRRADRRPAEPGPSRARPG